MKVTNEMSGNEEEDKKRLMYIDPKGSTYTLFSEMDKEVPFHMVIDDVPCLHVFSGDHNILGDIIMYTAESTIKVSVSYTDVNYVDDLYEYVYNKIYEKGQEYSNMHK